ncbi:MAG TPA: MFS transporter [Spirochaetia bacterium]|nr:MFS transporter [Spirochaetia bacterium]
MQGLSERRIKMDRQFIRDKSTFLAYLMLAFYGYCLNIFGPITPFLKEELALSYTVAGFHFSAFAAGMIAAGFAGHRVIRAAGARKALWLGAFGLSMSAVLVAAGRHAAVTIAASFLMGLIGSLVLSVVPAMLTDRHGEDRTVAFLEANVVASIVSAAAPVLVGLFASTALGWRAALAVAPLFPIAMRLGFGKIDLPQASRESAPREGRHPLPARYWVFWLAIVLSVSVEFCMVFWSADFFVSVRGMQKATASQSVTIFLAGMVLGRLAAGRVVRRFSPHALVTACVLIAAAGFLIFWVSPNPVLGAVGLFITGFGVAGLYPLNLSMAMGAAGDETAQAGSRAALASGLAIFTLPLLLGRLADAAGIRAAYGIVLVLAAAVLVINLATARGRRQA